MCGGEERLLSSAAEIIFIGIREPIIMSTEYVIMINLLRIRNEKDKRVKILFKIVAKPEKTRNLCLE